MTKQEKINLDNWKSFALNRAGFKCELCGKKTNLQVHHIVNRRSPQFRYDNDNSSVLDSGCHKFHLYFSAHVGSFLFHNWFFKAHTDRYIRLLDKLESRGWVL